MLVKIQGRNFVDTLDKYIITELYNAYTDSEKENIIEYK